MGGREGGGTIHIMCFCPHDFSKTNISRFFGAVYRQSIDDRPHQIKSNGTQQTLKHKRAGPVALDKTMHRDDKAVATAVPNLRRNAPHGSSRPS